MGSSNVGNGRSLQTNEVLPAVDIIPCPIFLCKSHLDIFQFRTLSHTFYFSGFTPQNNALSYLSPDFGGDLQPRRALSGGGGSRLASRQSRSENLRSGMLGPPPHPGSSFPSFPSSSRNREKVGSYIPLVPHHHSPDTIFALRAALGSVTQRDNDCNGRCYSNMKQRIDNATLQSPVPGCGSGSPQGCVHSLMLRTSVAHTTNLRAFALT